MNFHNFLMVLYGQIRNWFLKFNFSEFDARLDIKEISIEEVVMIKLSNCDFYQIKEISRSLKTLSRCWKISENHILDFHFDSKNNCVCILLLNDGKLSVLENHKKIFNDLIKYFF